MRFVTLGKVAPRNLKQRKSFSKPLLRSRERRRPRWRKRSLRRKRKSPAGRRQRRLRQRKRQQESAPQNQSSCCFCLPDPLIERLRPGVTTRRLLLTSQYEILKTEVRMALFSMKIDNLQELFVEQLRDLYDGEQQITEALPK